jgi:hypothetical protein
MRETSSSGRPRIKFRKSEIRKFVRFADLPQGWHFADSRFADSIYLWALLICDLRTQAFSGLQVSK